MLVAADERARVFAGNRAVGRIAFTVGFFDGITRRTRVHEAGSLRVRFPGARARELDAVVINSAGGIAGGDQFAVEIAAQTKAHVTASSAAAEKVYRSLGPDARIDIALKADSGASLAWLPQETILFDGARLTRNIDVDLAEDARLIIAEAIVFGRTGMGEAVQQGSLLDRWRVRRAGRLIYAETVRLDGAIAQKLGERAVAKGGAAIATVLLVPGTGDNVNAVRALESTFCGEVGVSTWNGLAVARLCAADGAALRHDLGAVLTALRGRLPHLWVN